MPLILIWFCNVWPYPVVILSPLPSFSRQPEMVIRARSEGSETTLEQRVFSMEG